ncbi:aldo/keto reductase [Mycolicibacterium komossense]|uniref:Aldo/keto reductase n=1 Tax=Mycolicibacterium komossense TaxID=1779 RepID=A0ABT3CHX4_9MYCO|nr:aldo/keto reductase [Mycolicibacterium komossense]MCV7228948.1 aldo/keto reductase [Mycolicibacterium komossense]
MSIFERRHIGDTPLKTTCIGYGSAPLGNRFRTLDEETCLRLVDDAWDHGVRFFDTAPMYGHGLAENRLGTALRRRSRDEYLLATKVGRLLRPVRTTSPDAMWTDVPPMGIIYDYSYDGTMRSVEDSLQRMLTDRIDIVFIHDCDRYGHGDEQPAVFEQAISGAARALFDLRDQGVIGAVGMGVNEADVCAAAARRAEFDVFLLAGRYTLLEHGPLDDLMPLCLDKGISLVLGGVFNSGILATGATAAAKHNYQPAAAAILNKVQAIETVCSRYDVPLAAAALQFSLAHPAVASVVVGASRLSQQRENFDAAMTPVPPEVWSELRENRLIRADAPTP